MLFDFNLIPLFFSVAVLTIIVLAVGISFAKNAFVMLIIIPTAFVCVFSIYKTVTDILGYPVAQTIPDKSFYLSHLPGPNKQWIYVWIVEPNATQPKNVKIPFNEQSRDELDEAEERQKKGIPQQLKGVQEQEGPGGPLSGGAYVSYDFLLDRQDLKQYNTQ